MEHSIYDLFKTRVGCELIKLKLEFRNALCGNLPQWISSKTIRRFHNLILGRRQINGETWPLNKGVVLYLVKNALKTYLFAT
jgi:hypothetical protein